jgi:hypothetical protein
MRGMPKGRRYANDHAPMLEEIQKLTEYPDRRIKPIIYTIEFLHLNILHKL